MIRAMSSSDIEKVNEIEQVCFKIPWSKDEFRCLLNFTDTIAVVCEKGEEIVGYGIGILFNSYLHIANLAVKPTYRRRGIGSKLISYVLNHACKKHKEFATLEVRVNNQAGINLYKKLGFKDKGIKESYYPDGESAIIMKKSLVLKGFLSPRE